LTLSIWAFFARPLWRELPKVFAKSAKPSVQDADKEIFLCVDFPEQALTLRRGFLNPVLSAVPIPGRLVSTSLTGG
jgi:hypothetical protein